MHQTVIAMLTGLLDQPLSKASVNSLNKNTDNKCCINSKSVFYLIFDLSTKSFVLFLELTQYFINFTALIIKLPCVFHWFVSKFHSMFAHFVLLFNYFIFNFVEKRMHTVLYRDVFMSALNELLPLNALRLIYEISFNYFDSVVCLNGCEDVNMDRC